MVRDKKPTPHGTVNGAVNYGCRCDPCMDAKREYNREADARRRARNRVPVDRLPSW